MELINQKVKSKSLGVGIIVEHTQDRVTVEFKDKDSKFPYPDAFEKKFLVAEDTSVQASILKEIQEAKAKAEEKKRKEEAERIAAKELKAAEEAEKRVSRRTSYQAKPVARTRRITGKRMTFFVFQRNTFEQECRGSYIWAPISNKAGNTFHHWDRLLDVQGGDIIVHGCNGYIQAVSVAKAGCYECPQPEELTAEDLWEREGRRVDCEYIRIEHPIKTSMFIQDIIRLCNTKYAPFDKFGNGNMGYLFELNRELAHIFIHASVDRNPYLGAVDYIQELLAEDCND